MGVLSAVITVHPSCVQSFPHWVVASFGEVCMHVPAGSLVFDQRLNRNPWKGRISSTHCECELERSWAGGAC